MASAAPVFADNVFSEPYRFIRLSDRTPQRPTETRKQPELGVADAAIRNHPPLTQPGGSEVWRQAGAPSWPRIGKILAALPLVGFMSRSLS